jgi:hypothetical protein
MVISHDTDTGREQTTDKDADNDTQVIDLRLLTRRNLLTHGKLQLFATCRSAQKQG